MAKKLKKPRKKRLEMVTRVISGDTKNAKHRDNQIRQRMG